MALQTFKPGYTILLLLALNLRLSANAPAADSTKIALNFTVGIKPSYGAGEVGIPPLSVSMDFAIPPLAIPGEIRTGWLVGTSSSQIEFNGGTVKTSHYLIATRSSYHYPLIEGVDTYATLLLGVRAIRAEENNFPGAQGRLPLRARPLVALQAGAKYYFMDQLGVMAEIGYGYSLINLGVCFRFQP